MFLNFRIIETGLKSVCRDVLQGRAQIRNTQCKLLRDSFYSRYKMHFPFMDDETANDIPVLLIKTNTVSMNNKTYFSSLYIFMSSDEKVLNVSDVCCTSTWVNITLLFF